MMANERAHSIGEDAYLRQVNEEIDRNSEDASLHLRKYFVLGGMKSDEARGYLEQSAKRFPADYRFLQLEAVDMVLKGDVDHAIEKLRSIISINPNAKESLYTLGTLLSRKKRYDEAIEVWNEVLKVDSQDHIGWTGKSSSEYHKRDYERAERHIDAALETVDEKNWIWALGSQGNSLYKEKSLRAIRANLRANRAQMRIKTGNYAGALEDYQTAHAEFPDETSEEVRNTILPRFSETDLRGSADLIEWLLDVDPDNDNNLPVYASLAAAYKFRGQKIEEWMDSVRRIMTKSQDPKMRLDILGAGLLRMGVTEHSLEVYRELVDNYHDNVHAFNVVQIATTLGKIEMARRYYPLIDQTALQKAHMFEVGEPAKTGRNDPCPCGSGTKFKKCHG